MCLCVGQSDDEDDPGTEQLHWWIQQHKAHAHTRHPGYDDTKSASDTAPHAHVTQSDRGPPGPISRPGCQGRALLTVGRINQLLISPKTWRHYLRPLSHNKASATSRAVVTQAHAHTCTSARTRTLNLYQAEDTQDTHAHIMACLEEKIFLCNVIYSAFFNQHWFFPLTHNGIGTKAKFTLWHTHAQAPSQADLQL